MIGRLYGLAVAIYARYSSDKQRRASIEDQVRRCTEWIVFHGGTVNPDLVFMDHAVSGKSLVRDELRRLLDLAYAKPRRLDVIVVEDVSRLSRDLADSTDLFRKLQFVGVQLVGIADGIDTSAKGAKLNHTVKSLMADLYLDDLRDKTLRGLEGRALAGLSTGGLPLGYRSLPEQGGQGGIIGYRIEIDPETAPIVVRIFLAYLNGHSLSGIAKMLNAERVPPPRAKTKHRRKGWGAGTIRAILHNTKYRGVWTFKARQWLTEPGTGKRQPKARDEKDVITRVRPDLRIVDEETCLAVESRLKSVHTHYTKNADGSPKGRSISGASASYLFSGIWSCAACGAPFVIYGGSNGSRYYRCADSLKRGTCDVRASFREDMARDLVLQAIRDQLGSPWGMAYARKLVAEHLGGQGAARERARSDRRARLERAEARISKLVGDIADGLPWKTVEGKLKDLEAQVADERQALADLERQEQIPVRLPSPKEVEQRVFDLYANLAADPAEGREALRRLFKDGKVYVRQDTDGVLLAQAELLPLAIVLAEKAIAAPGGSPRAAIYGGSSGGRI